MNSNDKDGISPEMSLIQETKFLNANEDSTPNVLVAKNKKENSQDDWFGGYLDKARIKDEGYAWIVLGAMFVTNMLTGGYAKGFSLIGNATMGLYPDVSGTMLGIMVGSLSSCRNLFAPAAGALGNVIGHRNTILFGTVLYVSGLIASFFCDSVLQLSITSGAIVGMSQCIIENSQVVIISQFFDSKLSSANGIRVAGFSFGGMVYPFLLTFLIENYGLKLLFVMLAGVTMHLFICAFLMRPIDVHIKIKAKTLVNKVSRNYIEEDGHPLCCKGEVNNSEIQIKQKELYDGIISNHLGACNKRKKKPLQFSYLKNPRFLLFIFMSAVLPVCLPIYMYYFIAYSESVIGLSPYEISMLMAIHGTADFFLKILIGWLNQKKIYKLTHGYATCLWLTGLGSMLTPLATNFWSLLCMVVFYSFATAGFHASVNVILCHQFGIESITSTWSFVKFTIGIFSLVHPPILGYIFDWTGSFTVIFLCMGIGLGFGGLIMIQ